MRRFHMVTMVTRWAAAAMLQCSLVTAGVAFAQGSALDSLGDAAARSTTRFTDRRVAVSDGYRRLGTDFPGMGEHWLHPRALLNGAIDPARPTMLTYANIGGKPTLIGVGFVVVTHGNEQPTNIPAWPDAWHEHGGFFSDESGVAPSRSAGDTHVWVLHIWTALANPLGRYMPDNWALPFARAGLAAPASVDADIGRAFSLSVGGDAYLRGIFIDARLSNNDNAGAIDSALTAARARALVVATRAHDAGRITDTDARDLRDTWHSLGVALHAQLGDAVDPFLAPPHAAHSHR